MRSFDYSSLKEKTWDSEIISLVAQIHECKGKQEVYLRQKPEELDKLVEIAKRQSTEASNAIEGIRTTSTRLKQLCEEKTTPKNRDEEEILGYRDVLNTIHENYGYIPIKANYILQLHRDLYKYTEKNIGGHFKTTQNVIAANKDLYYKALENCQEGWHENKEDAAPFIKYMLRIILAAYRDFEERIELVSEKLTAKETVRRAVFSKMGKLSKSDISELCPSIGIKSVELALKQLVEEGVLIKKGTGRATFYIRSDSE